MQKAVQQGTHIPDLTLAIATPDYTGSMAWLYGFDAVAPAQARVLELGCGDGEWLSLQAARWPEATWTGVELLSENKQDAQALIMAAGLENLAVCSTSLEQLLSADIGQYDYIIVHNTFSLLSNHKIECVLQYCQEHLSAQGLIAFAWACNPGAKNREVLRDAVQMHAAMAESLDQQIDCVRGMLSWFSLTSEGDAATPLATTALDESDNLSDELLVERYLRGQNEGQYLVEFNGRINQLGLGYVGDLKPWTESPEHYNERIGQMLSAICPTPNKILSQQYLDFATNRSVRLSLLGHKSKTENLAVFPDRDKLDEMNWAGSFRRIMEGMEACNAVRIHDDTTLTITDDRTLSVLDTLGDAWPFSLTFKQLLTLTELPDLPEGDHGEMNHSKLLLSLKALFDKGINGLQFRRAGFLPSIGGNSELILPVIGWKARNVRNVRNVWNEPVELSAEECAFLRNGEYIVSNETALIHDSLRFKGIMTGQPFAWKNYLQSLLSFSNESIKIRLINPIILFSSADSVGGFQTKEQQKLSAFYTRKQNFDISQLPKGILKKANELYELGEFSKVEEIYRQQVALHPNSVHANYLLANFYIRTLNYTSSADAMYKTIALQSNSWTILFELASVYLHQHFFWLAGRVGRAVLRCDRKNSFCWDLLARLHALVSEERRSEYCYKKALMLSENVNANILTNYALMLSSQLRSDEAIVCLRKAIKISKNTFSIHSALLFELMNSQRFSPDELFYEHVRFGKAVSNWLKGQIYCPYDRGRNLEHDRLRIGFVSGDLRHHPVANFLLPVWEGLDRRYFDIYAYSTYGEIDDVTERFRRHSTVFKNVVSKSMTELAELIKDDEINILIDLSGHTAHNRLATFAMRPAPVQMSWIGYPGTTGLPEMDYYILSKDIAPPGMLDSQFTEKLVYLPMAGQFLPEKNCPEVAMTPALKNGYFTFASFNRPMKITEGVISIWAKILHQAPTAKMLIGFMDNLEMIDSFTARFAAEGISSDRLIFRKTIPLQDFLHMHGEVDLLLDTFPYNGGTTTSHAAWMGVPTVTLAGQTLASRQGVDIMKRYGLLDFIATSHEDYVARAVTWVSRIAELNVIRQGLREGLLSALSQQMNISDAFAKMLSKAWEIWSSGEPTRSFSLDE